MEDAIRQLIDGNKRPLYRDSLLVYVCPDEPASEDEEPFWYDYQKCADAVLGSPPPNIGLERVLGWLERLRDTKCVAVVPSTVLAESEQVLATWSDAKWHSLDDDPCGDDDNADADDSSGSHRLFQDPVTGRCHLLSGFQQATIVWNCFPSLEKAMDAIREYKQGGGVGIGADDEINDHDLLDDLVAGSEEDVRAWMAAHGCGDTYTKTNVVRVFYDWPAHACVLTDCGMKGCSRMK